MWRSTRVALVVALVTTVVVVGCDFPLGDFSFSGDEGDPPSPSAVQYQGRAC